MKYCKVFRMVMVVLPILLLVVLSAPALAAPVITVSPATGALGTLVTVEGTNFDSYKGDNIYIDFDSTVVTTTPMVVPETGTFSLSFNVPGDADPGRHWIIVRTEIGTELASRLFTIPGTGIKLDIETGAVGAEVQITGEGFHSSKMVTFYYYNRAKDKLGSEMAGDTGEISYRFTVPESVAGKHVIAAEDAEGGVAEAEFEVIPVINLDPTSGAIGELLAVHGNGFGYRSDVGVYFDKTVMAYTKTDSYGTFSYVVFNIPEVASDRYGVSAKDMAGNMDKVDFTITAGIGLDKAMGSIGTDLTINGTGFTAGGTITIEYEDELVATVAADDKGIFESTFKVPVSKSGSQIITVSDDISTKYLTFTLESDAPPKPALVSPVNTSAVTAEAYFDWGDVADPSPPVTYTLQVAEDSDFVSVVMEKEGLAESDYLLTGEEKLAAVKKEAPYYWRVKAVDGAANEGEWSAPASFYIAAPLAPVLLLPETGIKAEAEVNFDWEDVTSLSPPVTYTLQVAEDSDFVSVVMEKKGLAESEYLLTGEEKLAAVKKEAPYYWRVKAVDGDANDGEWSALASFYVGFSMSGWLIYTLIGVAVLVAAFLAFWLGRRTAYYDSRGDD